MPSELVDKHHKQLAASGMPKMGSAELPPGEWVGTFAHQSYILAIGEGYVISIHGKDYIFPFAERSLPEGYLTTNYTA